VVAVSIMVLMGLMSFIGPLLGLKYPIVSTKYLFDDFSDNAIISSFMQNIGVVAFADDRDP
jgi:hypothetical protein